MNQSTTITITTAAAAKSSAVSNWTNECKDLDIAEQDRGITPMSMQWIQTHSQLEEWTNFNHSSFNQFLSLQLMNSTNSNSSSNSSNNTNGTKNKFTDEPVYRSISSMRQQQASSSGVDVMARESSPSMLSSSLDVKNAFNKTATTTTTVNTQHKGSVHVSKLVVNDFPLPLEMYPLSQTSCKVKEISKLDDVVNNIASSLGGSVEYHTGRIIAQSVAGTNITVTILRDNRSGECYLEFNRCEGCAFVFRYNYLKALHDSASYLDVDVDDVKAKLKSAEMKLNMWHGSSSSALSINSPLSPPNLKPRSFVSSSA